MAEYQLIHGDCREILTTLPAASVDLVIADPPYGDTALAWDVPITGWLPLVARVLRPSGSLWCFGSMRMFLGSGGEFNGWRLAQDLVWEKHNGSGFAADRFKRVHEHILQFYPAGVAWGDVYKDPPHTFDATRREIIRRSQPPHMGKVGRGYYNVGEDGKCLLRSVLFARSCHRQAIHPTQKPVEILDPLIRYSCPANGVVLDPFAGSASTGEAALRLGRSFIGLEKDQDYCDKALQRLERVAAQHTMTFEPVAASS